MSDPFMEEIERQAREAKAARDAQAPPAFKYNPVPGTDPETGGLIVTVDVPDGSGPDVLIEAMQEAARKAGLG